MIDYSKKRKKIIAFVSQQDSEQGLIFEKCIIKYVNCTL